MRLACENQVFKQFGINGRFEPLDVPEPVVAGENSFAMTGSIVGESGSVPMVCVSDKPASFRFEETEGGSLEEVPAALAKFYPLKVESWKCEMGAGGYVRFLGKVTNKTNQVMENVAVNARIEDAQGIVAKNETLIDYKTLRSGETSPFEALVDTGGRQGNCYLDFGYLFGERIEAQFP